MSSSHPSSSHPSTSHPSTLGISNFNYSTFESSLSELQNSRISTYHAIELSKYMEPINIKQKLDNIIQDKRLLNRIVKNISYEDRSDKKKKKNEVATQPSNASNTFSNNALKLNNIINNPPPSLIKSLTYNNNKILNNKTPSNEHLDSANKILELYKKSYREKKILQSTNNSNVKNENIIKSEIENLPPPSISVEPELIKINDIIKPIKTETINNPEPKIINPSIKLIQKSFKNECLNSNKFVMEMPVPTNDNESIIIEDITLPTINFDKIDYMHEIKLDNHVKWISPVNINKHGNTNSKAMVLTNTTDSVTDENLNIASDLVIRDWAIDKLRKDDSFEKVVPIIEDPNKIKDSQILDIFCNMLGTNLVSETPKLSSEITKLEPLRTPPELVMQRDRLDKMIKDQQKLQTMLEKLSAENEKKKHLIEPTKLNVKTSIEVKSDWKDNVYVDLLFDIQGLIIGGLESKRRKSLEDREKINFEKQLEIRRRELEFKWKKQQDEEAERIKKELEYASAQSALALSRKTALLEKSINALLNRPLETKQINTNVKVSLTELYVHNPPVSLNYQPESNSWIEISIFIPDLLSGTNILACPEFHNKLRIPKISKPTPIVEKSEIKVVESIPQLDSETHDKTLDMLNKLTDLHTKLENIGQLHWHALKAEAVTVETLKVNHNEYIKELKDLHLARSRPVNYNPIKIEDDISMCDSLSLDHSISYDGDDLNADLVAELMIDKASDVLSIRSNDLSEGEIEIFEDTLSEGELVI